MKIVTSRYNETELIARKIKSGRSASFQKNIWNSESSRGIDESKLGR